MKTRRAVLKSASTTIALPFLESFGFKSFASTGGKVVSAPKRMIFLGMGFGVTKETWFPDRSTTGKDYQLPSGLAPLEPHKSDITVIQNLQHQHSNEAHWGSTFWLTGANRFAIPGQSFHNSVSVDQVAAEHIGKETRFNSLHFDGKTTNLDGHGPGLSLAWNRGGKPVASLPSPVAAFHRLFSADSTPLEQRQAHLRRQQSVLDSVMENARTMTKGLTKDDVEKVDEYFQSVREIELRLSKEEAWLEVPKRQPENPVIVPEKTQKGVQEIELIYDLMAAAMEVDATRVFTYRMPANSLLLSLDESLGAHAVSHYRDETTQAASELRDKTHTKLLSKFFTKLKAINEPDGSSLFDNSIITFGSNISNVHHLNNCPTLLAGGGAGIEQGRHLVMDDPKTPLCNLWLSLLQGAGVNVDAHGDSTGTIEELFVA